jgi:hypothetical protein
VNRYELREIYAGLALTGLLGNTTLIDDNALGKVAPAYADRMAKDAVTFAEALVRAVLGEE